MTISDTQLSDHKMIEVKSSRLLVKTEKTSSKLYEKCNAFNFRSEKIDWSLIKTELRRDNWKSLLTDKTVKSQFILLTETSLESCMRNVPRRRGKPHRNEHQKKRRILWKKLKHAKENHSKFRNDKYKRKVQKIEKDLLDSFDNERTQNEKIAIGKIREDPKFFFKYANETIKTKSTVGPLLDSNKELNDDDLDICKIFKEQFASSFSVPTDSFDTKNFFNPGRENHLTDIEISTDDIIDAINELPNDTSAGPDTWPSRLLKNCKEELAVPLKIILENSIRSGEIPDELLKAHVIPVHKKGSRQCADNYRPISLTSLIAKVFERVLRKRIIKFLNEKNKISESQHGFRENRSCLSQLLEHQDRILDALEQGADYDVIYTDFSKAFDKCDFSILCRKLYQNEISGNIGRWIHTFLTRRTFQVTVNGSMSSEEKVRSSVPQGAILAPTLFLIMINDIGDNITDCDISSFADDTKISKGIKSPSDSTLLQNGVYKLSDWTTDNNMLFNEKKFIHIRHTLAADEHTEEIYLTKEGHKITRVSETTDLGTTVTSTLSLREDIERSVKKARQKSGWALRTFKSRDRLTITTLYKSMVRPHLEYNSVLVNPHLKKDIARLEGVQRTITSKIYTLKDYDYFERLKALRMSSIERRRDRYTIMHVWKIIHNLAPNLPMNPIETYINQRRGRLCKVPEPRKGCSRRAKKLRSESFAIRGPKLFNLIPAELRNFSSNKISGFKNRLDKFLSKIPDEPTVDGYQCQRSETSNSLLTMIPAQKRRAMRE